MRTTRQPEQPLTRQGAPDPIRYAAPPVSLLENAEGYTLRLEMPGVARAGVEITVDNGELLVVGHRADPDLTGQILRRESRRADYRRAFELDPAVDHQRISAKVEQGVVTLTLPRSEAVKPRRINVTD